MIIEKRIQLDKCQQRLVPIIPTNVRLWTGEGIEVTFAKNSLGKKKTGALNNAPENQSIYF